MVFQNIAIDQIIITQRTIYRMNNYIIVIKL